MRVAFGMLFRSDNYEAMQAFKARLTPEQQALPRDEASFSTHLYDTNPITGNTEYVRSNRIFFYAIGEKDVKRLNDFFTSQDRAKKLHQEVQHLERKTKRARSRNHWWKVTTDRRKELTEAFKQAKKMEETIHRQGRQLWKNLIGTSKRLLGQTTSAQSH